MSNALLLNATLPDHVGPKFTFPGKLIQRLYKKAQFKNCPIDLEFLEQVVEELKVFKIHAYVKPGITTEDGTQWLAALVLPFPPKSEDGRKYLILFPKAEDEALTDGTYANSSVALYAEGSDSIPDEDADKMVQTVFSAIMFGEKMKAL